ncbi:hypothetical protein RIF29_27452 [Crotalaria pallida]|uniref:Uncharacterized protein n=1 Tax=Crotalaria pallida TaxID=3830 RepID=A0AAN9EQ08_CROPI
MNHCPLVVDLNGYWLNDDSKLSGIRVHGAMDYNMISHRFEARKEEHDRVARSGASQMVVHNSASDLGRTVGVR